MHKIQQEFLLFRQFSAATSNTRLLAIASYGLRLENEDIRVAAIPVSLHCFC